MAEKNIVKENRIGTFTISHDIIRNNPEGLLELFGKVIVVKCESLFYGGKLKYIAFSEMFEPVSEGIVETEYIIEVTKEKVEDGSKHYFKHHFKAVKA